jgi:rhodanese-related sulfurtransferase
MDFIFKPSSSMKEVETFFPFARTTLHSQFHIGGCKSCGYEQNQTIEEVAKKYNQNSQEMTRILNAGLQNMKNSQITPQDLSHFIESKKPLLIVDVRENWEFQITHFPNSFLLTEENFKETIAKSKDVDLVVVVCHHGLRSLNAALYLRENGLLNAKSLQGGIDTYSATIDKSIPRY